jgi:hypothetical protein
MHKETAPDADPRVISENSQPPGLIRGEGMAKRQYLFTQVGALRTPGFGSNSARTPLRFGFTNHFMSYCRQSRALLRQLILPDRGIRGIRRARRTFRNFCL